MVRARGGGGPRVPGRGEQYRPGTSFLNIDLQVVPFTTTALASENLQRLGPFADFDLWALANLPFTSQFQLASARKSFKKLAEHHNVVTTIGGGGGLWLSVDCHHHRNTPPALHGDKITRNIATWNGQRKGEGEITLSGFYPRVFAPKYPHTANWVF